MSDLLPPSERLFQPLSLPQDRLLTGPGPANCPPRALEASGMHLLGHLHPEFTKVMDDIKAGLQYLFQTENTLTIAVSGTGHAGIEAAFVNIVEKGDRVLVLKNGLWGGRVADIAERCGATVNILERPAGQVFSLEEIEKGLQLHQPAVLSVCHGESSGGTVQPLEGLGELCHKYGCLVFVDTVASLGGVPFYTDKWELDIVSSGSQKCIGAPPGAAPITFSPRAREKMATRKTKVQSFYFDMGWLAKYWAVDGLQRVYHHTAPISVFYALREGLALIAQEGLESVWRRHRENAELLWNGLENIGLEMFLKDKDIRLVTVNAVKVPDGVQWKEVTTYIMKKYEIEVSGGLGPTAGRIWRIGIMGYNSSKGVVGRVLEAMDDGMKQIGANNKL